MNLHDFLTHLSGEPAWVHAGAVTPLTRESNGDTPLHAAIWARDDEAARQLIDAGADVNAPGEDGYTPIHAALAQSNVPLARRLTARGASWDAVNKFACTVRDAARRSDDPAVRALLEQEELVSQLPGRIGHFRLESGHHSDLWTDLELLCLRPEFVRQRAATLAARLGRHRVDAVCGPLVEGAFVALMVASDLGVEFYYTERFVPQADGPGTRCFRWSTAFQRFFAASSTANASRSSTMSSAPGRRSEVRSPISNPAAPKRSLWQRSPC